MIEPLPHNDLSELVTANHILYEHNVVDGFGHVSLRDPRYPNRFWMARSMAPGLVGAADILAFDSDSNPLSSNPPPIYVERFIHGEIYRRYPEVTSVVHSHATAIIPFGVVSTVPLRPVFHMSAFLGAGAPVFEIRDHAGSASDLLIRDRNLGAALAQTLGKGAVVLMRGHGATIVGRALRQAVFRAVYAAMNAALQGTALQLGPINYLTGEEAEAAAHSVDAHVDRAWNLWAHSVECGTPTRGG
jgi:ribulose-5-phosphate 4-epimerase/fuculose-1-phosphate aldolase